MCSVPGADRLPRVRGDKGREVRDLGWVVRARAEKDQEAAGGGSSGASGLVISLSLPHHGGYNEDALTENRPLFGPGRLRGALAALIVVVLVASCTTDAVVDGPAEETSAPSTIGEQVTATNAEVETETPTTEISTTTSTTELFPSRAVVRYLEDMQAIAVRVGELMVDMNAANNDWDNRSETGASYEDTEAAMEDISERALVLRNDIGLIEVPSDRGLPVEHQTAWVAVGQMADAAVEALAGLRSPDTGERRREGVAAFLVAFERFSGAFDRILEIIGVGAGISAPTTTSTTEAATTTTAAVTTTTSSAAPTTTEAESPTTSTTEAATTTTTEAATTIPPAPDVGYSVVDEFNAGSQGAEAYVLTVLVDEGATRSQLTALANRLSFEYQVARSYQALLIEFSHFPEGQATLGRWTHAPFGDWNRAGEVEEGDYSQHQTDDRTVDKDWSLLPTDAEVDLYRAYADYRSALEDSGVLPPDDQLIALAADDLGTTVGEIRDAIEAWEAWVAP